MISTFKNIWRVPELRKRLLWTFVLVLLYRLGDQILVPGIDATRLANLAHSGTLFSFYDLISGGSFSRFSIFAMGVTPYINSSIVIQLLTVAIPALESMQKEGEEGRKKLQNYTRYGAIAFALLQSISTYAIMVNFGAIPDSSRTWLNVFLIVTIVTTASTFLMWLGDQITVKGIGNGISLLIFVNIISRIPSQAGTVSGYSDQMPVQVITFVVLIFAVLFAIIVMSLAERRIPVQYAGKTVGNKIYKGQSTHIPINVNASGIIAIIFAMSVLQFPSTIAQFFPKSSFWLLLSKGSHSIFYDKSWEYALANFLLVIFFTWFYTEVTFKPEEMAENMHKSSGFIPGIRPGEPTAEYITKVLAKISIIGGAFAGLVAVFPLIFTAMGMEGISFGGTSLLIMVGVAVETSRQIEAQLVMRHYQGFLK